MRMVAVPGGGNSGSAFGKCRSWECWENLVGKGSAVIAVSWRWLCGVLTVVALVVGPVAVTAEPAEASVAWSAVPSPSPGSISALHGVSCADRDYCVAAGESFSGGVYRTLIETWNGTSWSVTPSPTPINPSGSSFVAVEGVSCIGRNFCLAVGGSLASGATRTLIETWNGVSWSITPSPNQGTGDNFLNGVSCTDTSYCVAVGRSDFQTLIETWNGIGWTITPSPNKTSFTILIGVTCTNSVRCEAVGFYSNGVRQTLVETWNGTDWSITPSPNQGTGDNRLDGVSCARANQCTAVGSSNATNLTLIETWNGKTWSITPSPNPGSSNNLLQGVSCSPMRGCRAAVGGEFNNIRDAQQTLILMRTH